MTGDDTRDSVENVQLLNLRRLRSYVRGKSLAQCCHLHHSRLSRSNLWRMARTLRSIGRNSAWHSHMAHTWSTKLLSSSANACPSASNARRCDGALNCGGKAGAEDDGVTSPWNGMPLL